METLEYKMFTKIIHIQEEKDMLNVERRIAIIKEVLDEYHIKDEKVKSHMYGAATDSVGDKLFSIEFGLNENDIEDCFKAALRTYLVAVAIPKYGECPKVEKFDITVEYIYNGETKKTAQTNIETLYDLCTNMSLDEVKRFIRRPKGGKLKCKKQDL